MIGKIIGGIAVTAGVLVLPIKALNFLDERHAIPEYIATKEDLQDLSFLIELKELNEEIVRLEERVEYYEIKADNEPLSETDRIRYPKALEELEEAKEKRDNFVRNR